MPDQDDVFQPVMVNEVDDRSNTVLVCNPHAHRSRPVTGKRGCLCAVPFLREVVYDLLPRPSAMPRSMYQDKCFAHSEFSSIRAIYCIASRDPSTSASAPAHSTVKDLSVRSPKNKSFTARISASNRWIFVWAKGVSVRSAPRPSDGLVCFLNRPAAESFPASAVTKELETCIACATDPTLTPAAP